MTQVEIETLLAKIPEKESFISTTSKQFKLDVINFFNKPEFKEKIAMEMGCDQCHSTVILAALFKYVYALDNVPNAEAEAFLKQCGVTNASRILCDLYDENPLPVSTADVVFVDAWHTYEGVHTDVLNALNLPSKEKKYFIFDDVGIYPEIKRAVEEFFAEGKLKLVKKIGRAPHDPQHLWFMPNLKLEDYEGLIAIEA